MTPMNLTIRDMYEPRREHTGTRVEAIDLETHRRSCVCHVEACGCVIACEHSRESPVRYCNEHALFPVVPVNEFESSCCPGEHKGSPHPRMPLPRAIAQPRNHVPRWFVAIGRRITPARSLVAAIGWWLLLLACVPAAATLGMLTAHYVRVPTRVHELEERTDD